MKDKIQDVGNQAYIGDGVSGLFLSDFQLSQTSISIPYYLTTGTAIAQQPMVTLSTGSGTVTNFSKVDGFGIISSVSNPTTTPVLTIRTDTTAVRTVLNSYTKAQVDAKIRPTNTTIYTATGNGVNATVTIPHGYTGVTSSSGVNVQARNASSAGITYATIDANNVYVFYSVAPTNGASLSYSIIISPTTFNPF